MCYIAWICTQNINSQSNKTNIEDFVKMLAKSMPQLGISISQEGMWSIFSVFSNLNCYNFSLKHCCSLPASPRRLANLRDVQHMARLQEVSQLPTQSSCHVLHFHFGIHVQTDCSKKYSCIKKHMARLQEVSPPNPVAMFCILKCAN